MDLDRRNPFRKLKRQQSREPRRGPEPLRRLSPCHISVRRLLQGPFADAHKQLQANSKRIFPQGLAINDAGSDWRIIRF